MQVQHLADEQYAIKRALAILLNIHGKQYIKARDMGGQMDLSPKAASRRLRYAKYKGWVSIWREQTPKTYEIEL